MKKVLKSIFAVVLFLTANISVNQVHADNVDLAKAKQIGAYYMKVQSGAKSLTPENLDLVYQIDNTVMQVPALYFFNTTNNGFVIVAGNDCMDPIIGYSTEKGLDPNNMPSNLLWFLNGYVQSIVYAQNNDLQPSKEIKASWNELLNEELAPATPKQIYKTLQSTWGQDYPYNAHCPVINGENACTGCVATAMAQIIKYWEYPIAPTGNVTYNGGTAHFGQYKFDYSLMPNEYVYGGWSEDQVNEVADLNYLCGVSVRMSYGTTEQGGSGAVTNMYLEKAMTNNWKYDKNSFQSLNRRNAQWQWSNTSTSTPTHGDTLWVDTCVKEIKAKRPVFYTGADLTSGGKDARHAWVLDGYNSSNKRVHMNFGWDGYGDGYFNLYTSNLNALSYHFTSEHTAYFMRPPQDTLDARMVAIDRVENDVFTAPAYPNPTSSIFTIPYKLNDGSAILQVISADGRVIESRKIEGEGSVTLNVRNWAKGVYIYRINGCSKKFIVQ